MLCGDDDTARYVEMWFAQVLQFPGKKAGIILVLMGDQGCGKSLLAEDFSKRLLGQEIFGYTAQAARDVFSRFSTIRINKLIINMDESQAATMQKNADVLKSMVTQKTCMSEQKCVDQVEVEDFSRIILTTNNKNGGTKAEHTARRDFPIHCAATMVGNRQYFLDIVAWLESDANIVATYCYLMSLDVLGFDFSKKPRGPGMDDHMFRALPTVIKYLVCEVLGACPEDCVTVSTSPCMTEYGAKELRDLANKWVADCKEKDRDCDLVTVGERGITAGLDRLIKKGAVEVVKKSCIVYQFMWEDVVKHLAEFAPMHDVY
jgi:hypothetical protein